ncbi:MarR family winged helix-turn-helix transcriptional regulator [Sphingomonas sp. CLY1604]|uniref:MarR family winged helix-turn-helix transcriptional regulator n=1 Tax=Sphingomonas sp. CLY1604 TaxID=3457786 RepID=UPI003FD7A92C
MGHTMLRGRRSGDPAGDEPIGSAGAYTMAGRPMLLIAADISAAEAEAAIRLAGGRLLQRIDWGEVAATLLRLATWPVIVCDTAGVPADVLDAELPRIARYVEQAAVSAVIALSADQIDLVAAHVLGSHAVLLCDPTPADRVIALAAAASVHPPMLHDTLHEENDRERLQRLNDEVAHIARLLAGLAGPAPASAMPREIADRRRGFESEPAVRTHAVSAQEVRHMIQLRRLRAKFFGQFIGDGLFEDPAWDMLLDLFAAELEGTRVSVSSLCIAAGVAPTTALRWIAKMSDMGLFVRHPDPVDRRRAFMALAPRASEAMRNYMVAARKADPA